MRFRDLKKQSQKNNREKHDQQKVVYAKYTDKIKALITDIFMMYIPILYIITYVFLDGKDDFQASQSAPFIAVSLYGVIYALLISKFGQTPGKKAYKIKVVDVKTHRQISFLRAFLRFIAFLFSATILLGLILPFYRKDKRALHDLLAKTSEISDI
jgi:uncharacterized RDD family membrane protein YckC